MAWAASWSRTRRTWATKITCVGEGEPLLLVPHTVYKATTHAIDYDIVNLEVSVRVGLRRIEELANRDGSCTGGCCRFALEGRLMICL